jgi:hypothetical protein
LRNTDAGIINQLTFTHNRIRRELQEYFGGVRLFADEQGAKVRDAVELYRTTERELAATMDQTLFDQPTQDDVRSEEGRLRSLESGRSSSARAVPARGSSFPLATAAGISLLRTVLAAPVRHQRRPVGWVAGP